jgi:hypothetical protein
MEKGCYQEIITEVSNRLAEKILSEIGLRTVQKVLENTRDEIVAKKKQRD